MRVLIDLDASNDDAVAVMYLASHPNVDLRAITVAGTGEAHGLAGAQNMARLCKFLEKPDLPVAYGEDKPCSPHGKPFPDYIRDAADHLFDKTDVPQHAAPNISSDALALIKRILEENDEPTVIVATGPLTNIAKFIQVYPELATKIKKIVIMGGAVDDTKGNIQALLPESDNTVAEWNIYADPKAAEIVFQSGVPVVLVPLNATNQVPMTKPFYDELASERQPVPHLIYELLKLIVDQFGMEMFLKEFYLWDPLAAMIAVEPEMAQLETVPIVMELDSAQTRRAKPEEQGAAIIQFAKTIIKPETVLDRLVKIISKPAYHTPNPGIEKLLLPFDVSAMSVKGYAALRDVIFNRLGKSPDKDYLGGDFKSPDTTQFVIENKFVHTHDGAILDTMILTPKSQLSVPSEDRHYIVKFNPLGAVYLDFIKLHEKDAFETNTSVILFDYRGHRYSQKKPQCFLDLIIDGLAQVQRLLSAGIKPGNIILDGHSLGGAVATFVACILHHLGKQVYLWNDRSFSSFSQAAAGFVFSSLNDRFKYSFIELGLSYLTPKLFQRNGFEAIVKDAYNEIPANFKGYLVVAKKSEKTGSAGDGVVTHDASHHKSVSAYEKLRDKPTGHKVIFDKTRATTFPRVGHIAPRSELISKKDSSKTGQDVYNEFVQKAKI